MNEAWNFTTKKWFKRLLEPSSTLFCCCGFVKGSAHFLPWKKDDNGIYHAKPIKGMKPRFEKAMYLTNIQYLFARNLSESSENSNVPNATTAADKTKKGNGFFFK